MLKEKPGLEGACGLFYDAANPPTVLPQYKKSANNL